MATTRPIMDLVGTVISFTVSTIASPLALFLVYRIKKSAQLSALSMQVRLQIGIWTLIVLTIFLMTATILVYWLLALKDGVDSNGRYIPSANETSGRIRSPDYKINKQVMFFFNAFYILVYSSSTITSTMLLVDRCTALMFPIYYGKMIGKVLKCVSFTAISALTLIVCSYLFVDSASFYTSRCYSSYCFFPKSLAFVFYLKFTFVIINSSLAVLLCVLLFKHHRRTLMFHNNVQYFSRMSNLIALWSFFSEIASVLPYYAHVVKLIFNIIIPVQDNLIMATISLDGLFAILIYIKIMVLKKHRVVPSSNSSNWRGGGSQRDIEQANSVFSIR